MKTLFCLLTLLPFLSDMETCRQDMNEASRHLRALKNYSVRIRHRLYVDGQLNRPFQERNIELARMENNLFVKKDNGQELLRNERYRVLVDRPHKRLLVGESLPEKELKAMREEEESGFDEGLSLVMDTYETVKVVKRSGELAVYEIGFGAGSEIEKATVEIDTKKKFFRKMRVDYRNKRTLHELGGGKHKLSLETEYFGMKANAVRDGDLFNEKKYIEVNHGEVKGAAGFKEFKLGRF